MIETLPSSLRRCDEVEDHRPLLGAHRRQRLVKQDDVGVAGDRPRHRDRLALAAGEARRRDIDRGDVDPDLVQRLAGLTAHQGVGQERDRLADALAAQKQVLVDRQLVDQRQILKDGVDPALAAIVDRPGRVRLALDPQRAGVGLLEASEDLDQRRLAGAVVAQQTQHLALAQVEADVAQGGGGAEALADMLDAQHVVVGHRRLDDDLVRWCLVSHGRTPFSRGRHTC